MRRVSKACLVVFSAMVLLFAPLVYAQTASPNADLLKMIEAGLPESVVVNKINENAGQWDTSVDALIVLKKAGATSAEMTALTAPPPTAVRQVAAAPAAPIVVAGGVLQRTQAGDIYLKFPEPRTTVFPNGEPSNLAWLVSFEGRPAVRVPGERVDGDMTSGNLIITHDRVIFDPYLVEYYWGFYPKNGKYVLSKKAWQEMTRDATLNMARTDVKLNYINMNDFPSTRATIFSKGTKAYNIGFHFVGVPYYLPHNPINLCARSEDCLSPQLEAFVRNLIRDFDGTVAPFLAAAGITDVDKQLTALSHYQLTTEADLPKWAAIYQAQIDQLPPPTKTGGGFLAGLAEGLQIAAAGASALQQSNDGGNTIAAQQAAKAQYNQNVATIESGGTPTLFTPVAAAPQPVVATPAPAAAPGKSGFKIEPKKAYQGTVTGGNSGTVAPPVAYVPPASTGGTVVSAVCPASGFVPGLFKSYGDAATAVPCTPGQPIGTSGGTSVSSSAPDAGTGLKTTPVLTTCLLQSFVNDDLTVTNGCNVPVYATWWVNGHSGSWTLNPGEHTGTGYTSSDVGAGGASYYVCPKNASPADASGHNLTGPVSSYVCVVRY